jgi:hypothetical protein
VSFAVVVSRAVLLLACGISSCSRGPSSSVIPSSDGNSPPDEQGEVAGAEHLVVPYPAGRWRLAVPAELGQTQLWGSHILIAHRETEPGVASFELPDWLPGARAPERTRKEAFELAQRIAALAAATPAEFGRLAREYSEDPGTKDGGGSLGGRSALELSRWPEVLDAFAVLQPGQVSRVLETEFGFHVLMRSSPPEERRLSGAHIVIGHDQAPWLHRFLARRPVSRSRADAMALAQQVYAELQREPTRFSQLVEQYSDHRDAVRGGDWGEWSSREPTAFYRELDVLSHLDVGAVAAPIDSPFGVQIIVRTPLRYRRPYAVEAIVRGFNPALAADDVNSRASVLGELEALLPRVARDRPLFAELSARYCCDGVKDWQEGRGDALEESVLAQLELGQVAAELIVERDRASIIRRVEPAEPRPVPVSLELPEPAAPNIDYLVSTYGADPLIPAVEDRVIPQLALEPALVDRLRGLRGYVERIQMATTQEDRLTLFREYQRTLQGLLGQRYEQYERLFEGYTAERLLRLRADAKYRDAESGLPIAGWPSL